jgi:hypothetical protein
MMSHEKLDVYQAAIEFFDLAAKLCSEFPKGHSDLLDQFRRASMSIPLSFAESVGKNSKPDMKRFLLSGLKTTDKNGPFHNYVTHFPGHDWYLQRPRYVTYVSGKKCNLCLGLHIAHYVDYVDAHVNVQDYD